MRVQACITVGVIDSFLLANAKPKEKEYLSKQKCLSESKKAWMEIKSVWKIWINVPVPA